MRNDEIENNIIDNSIYSAYVGIRFSNGARIYYFGIKNEKLKENDYVVVETARGIELGIVATPTFPMIEYKSNLGLKPIIRIASKEDIKAYEENIKSAENALKICKSEVENLNLNMNLISCEYTLDKAKVSFSYLADARVDFRELLKVLAARLHTRIDLRQIGPRDKAKNTGGLGMCGMPICCSTFLNEFDGISVNKAKNQMLTINIPKLSGQCGKLLCCLKYEDDVYTCEKKYYPEIGTRVFIDKVEYTVSGINIISKTVRLENPDGIMNLTLEDFKKQVNNKNVTPNQTKENEEK